MDKYSRCLKWQRVAIGYSIRDYPISIIFLAKDGPYVGDISDLIYCSAFGDTPE